jgi:hypothetical protein
MSDDQAFVVYFTCIGREVLSMEMLKLERNKNELRND